ncbi:MAG: LEA14-like dessication related protein [Candidatus Azotimanducaceae bacterium]|jgi:LEA14-like dessication related protein
MKSLPRLFVLLATWLLNGCATMDPDYQRLKVNVVGIDKSHTNAAALQFTIKLRIVNPNAETINLKGLDYELSLDGIDVVNGTARDIPPIAGYSDLVVSVSAAANLFNSLRLAARLMDASGAEIPYELRAKRGTSSK